MADQQEQNRGWLQSLLWGFGFLTLFGVVNVKTPDKPAATVEVAKPAAAAAGGAAVVDGGKSPCSLSAPLEALASALGRCPGAQGWPFANGAPRVLLATVPDPDALSFGNYAGQAMESILRAASSAGYSFDRHWLPWTPETAVAARQQFAPRQTEPGVMIFRHGAGPWLVVFLIGETPTGGIHRNVFHKASSYALQLNDKDSRLYVLGPTYSGSAPSLRDAIDQAGGRASVITGSATSPGIQPLLHRGETKFESTVENDDEALARFQVFMQQRRRRAVRSAYLLETGTDYANRKEEPDLINYYFPMQIARLRAAYQNDPVLREQGKALRNRTGLDLRFDETSAGFDKFPDYAVDSTALSQELSLERMTLQLLDQDPDFVSIFASDIRDLLFLSSFLRKRLPAFPLVLMDSDVLYSNESDRYSLTGALSLATYPLILDTQNWSHQTGRRQFPSQVAQGIYNATLAHLGQRELMLDMERVGPADAVPVWLTMFAGGSTWPVATLPPAAVSGRWLKPRGTVVPEYGPLRISFGFFVTMLAVMPALLVLASTGWFRKLPIPDEARTWLEEFDQKMLAAEPVAAGILLASVASIQALLVCVLGHYAASMGGQREFSWFVVPVLVLALGNLVAAGYLWARCVAALQWRATTLVARWGLVLVTMGGVAGVMTFLTLRTSFEADNLSNFFFIYRCLHLDGGASPLVPMALLLLVVCISAWSHLRGNGIWLSHLPKFGNATGTLQQAAVIIADAVGGGRWPMWGGLAWITVSVFGIQLWQLWTVESRTYNIAFGIVMGAAYWSLSYLFLRLLRTGHQVRRAAAELEEAGYATEFANLQALRPWGLWEGHSWRSIRAARAKQLAVLGLSTELQGPEAKRMVDERVTPDTIAMPIQFALAIQLVLRILRRQLLFLGAGIVCTLIAFQSYPFEPRQWISGYVALTSLGMSGIVFMMLIRVEHDPLLAKLFGNERKGLDLQFYLRTGGALLVPLVTVISSLFPDIGQELTRWILPWMQTGRQ